MANLNDPDSSRRALLTAIKFNPTGLEYKEKDYDKVNANLDEADQRNRNMFEKENMAFANMASQLKKQVPATAHQSPLIAERMKKYTGDLRQSIEASGGRLSTFLKNNPTLHTDILSKMESDPVFRQLPQNYQVAENLSKEDQKDVVLYQNGLIATDKDSPLTADKLLNIANSTDPNNYGKFQIYPSDYVKGTEDDVVTDVMKIYSAVGDIKNGGENYQTANTTLQSLGIPVEGVRWSNSSNEYNLQAAQQQLENHSDLLKKKIINTIANPNNRTDLENKSYNNYVKNNPDKSRAVTDALNIIASERLRSILNKGREIALQKTSDFQSNPIQPPKTGGSGGGDPDTIVSNLMTLGTPISNQPNETINAYFSAESLLSENDLKDLSDEKKLLGIMAKYNPEIENLYKQYGDIDSLSKAVEEDPEIREKVKGIFANDPKIINAFNPNSSLEGFYSGYLSKSGFNYNDKLSSRIKTAFMNYGTDLKNSSNWITIPAIKSDAVNDEQSRQIIKELDSQKESSLKKLISEGNVFSPNGERLEFLTDIPFGSLLIQKDSPIHVGMQPYIKEGKFHIGDGRGGTKAVSFSELKNIQKNISEKNKSQNQNISANNSVGIGNPELPINKNYSEYSNPPEDENIPNNLDLKMARTIQFNILIPSDKLNRFWSKDYVTKNGKSFDDLPTHIENGKEFTAIPVVIVDDKPDGNTISGVGHVWSILNAATNRTAGKASPIEDTSLDIKTSK